MRLAPVVIVLAACGDTVTVEPLVEPASGTRIELEQYLYEDGTRQLAAGTYYDGREHTRCAPQKWVDGVVRCVPLDAEAVFVDDTCTEVRGIVRQTPERAPTRYVGYDTIGGARVAARVYAAGVQTDHVDTYYERYEGQCYGPVFAPPEAVFVSVVGELTGDSLAPMAESKIGSGRLSLHVQTTEDGLFAPFELLDTTFGTACTPALREDGVVCEPRDSFSSNYFANASCTQPALVTFEGQLVPPLVRYTEPTGCPSFRTIGGEITGTVWVLNDTSCSAVSLPDNEHAYELAPPTELPVLDRTVEDAPVSRRLAHVTLTDASDTDLRFTGDSLVDRATRGECNRMTIGEDVRCVPPTVAASYLYTDATCTTVTPVAAVPQRACTPLAFATTPSDDGTTITVHAIGDAIATYTVTDLGCKPYAPWGITLHQIGPALPPDVFPAATRYSER